MVRPSPALPSVAWTVELATLLETASLAIGRLDARVCASSVAPAWRLRAAWTGYTRALQLQSVEIDEIDVYSWGCGLVLPRRAPRSSVGNAFAAFVPWQNALAARGRHWREDLPFAVEVSDDFTAAPALLRALEIVWQYAVATDDEQPWLALPTLLQRLGVTKTPLPCLVVGDKRFRLSQRPDDAMLRRSLKAIAQAAYEGLARLDAMETDRARAMAGIAAERRPGMLVQLLAFAQHNPLLSPQHVSTRLHLSLSGAGKLLTRAAELGTLVEVSGRRSWRTYLPPDLAIVFGFVPPPRGRPVGPPALPHDRALAGMLEAFDVEMAEFDAKHSLLIDVA